MCSGSPAVDRFQCSPQNKSSCSGAGRLGLWKEEGKPGRASSKHGEGGAQGVCPGAFGVLGPPGHAHRGPGPAPAPPRPASIQSGKWCRNQCSGPWFTAGGPGIWRGAVCVITVYYREGMEVGAQARLKFKVHVTGFWLAWGQCVAEIISFCGLAWLLSGGPVRNGG